VNDTGAFHIGNYLSRNPPLQKLYLGGNRITSIGAVHIAQGFTNNTNLLLVDFDACEIDFSGLDFIVDVLTGSTNQCVLRQIWFTHNQFQETDMDPFLRNFKKLLDGVRKLEDFHVSSRNPGGIPEPLKIKELVSKYGKNGSLSTKLRKLVVDHICYEIE